MNVIPFPRESRVPAAAPPSPLAWVVIGLRRVGEPATSAEIAKAIGHNSAAGAPDTRAVEDVLVANARGGDAEPVFQQVMLRGVLAWGLTPEFRLSLRRSGLPPVWRAM
ncbi:MAG: hypothetical protein ACOY5Y_04685 [Pseudomonadota bacterium]